MSQALSSTLHFDVHACSTVFLTAELKGPPRLHPLPEGELPRAQNKNKNKNKIKGAALLDFKNRKTDERDEAEDKKGREGGKIEK